MSARSRGFPAAGVFVGPLAWAMSTQGGYSFNALICARSGSVYLVLACAWLMTVSLAAAYVSFESTGDGIPGDDGNPRRFLATLGTGTGVLFAVVICLQGLAALTLSGCAR
jgi:hypothetical protein